jgi:putative membrane protein
MSITHTFLDSIPSIYLGVPDPALALSVLPAHRMFLQGKAQLALKYTLYGSLTGLILSLILAPLLVFLIPLIYINLKNYIGYIILVILLFLFLKDTKRLLKNLAIFFTAGTFGLLVLNLNLNQPMYHMFSGLFGVSNLALSLSNSKFVKQEFHKIVLNLKHKISSLIAVIVGVFAAFMPGLGSSQSAILGMSLMKKDDCNDPKIFLTFMGGINTVNMFVSLITFYSISKARNGSIVALQNLFGSISLELMVLVMCCCLVAGSFAIFVALFVSKNISILIEKINYKKLIIFIIFFVFVLSVIFDSLIGFLILFVASSLGILTSRLGVAKSFLMGCLLVQVLIFLL